MALQGMKQPAPNALEDIYEFGIGALDTFKNVEDIILTDSEGSGTAVNKKVAENTDSFFSQFSNKNFVLLLAVVLGFLIITKK